MFKIGFKIINLVNELFDKLKKIFIFAFNLGNKYETNVTSFHTLYIILENPDKYINIILGSITPNANKIKLNIFELLDKSNHLSRTQEVDKSILFLINTSKMLLKEIDDQIITQEILSKHNITNNTLLKDKEI